MRWLSLFILLLLPAPAVAQGWIEPLVARPGVAATRVERLRTSVTVRITDRVARVEVEEWFRNAGGGTAENGRSEPFSAAYFKLLEKLPEVTPYLSAFDTVIVRGRDVSIRVAAGGRSTLAAIDLDTMVRDFRPR
jgi:hypothetical protein